MTEAPDVLDEAFDRLGRWGFDEPNNFVNHAPMVCEALSTLKRPKEVDSWSRTEIGSEPVIPVAPRRFDWRDALGDTRRCGEWMGFFERAIETEGWEAVLSTWVPRLMPGLSAALFHGAIRAAHGARALEGADTPSRRAELVRVLGYWAGLFEPGYPPDLAGVDEVDDVQAAIADTAAAGARRYLSKPNIFNLHGVTAAMAVSILARHVNEGDGLTALATLRAEHAALYERTAPIAEVPEVDVDDVTLVNAAVASGDAHAVKLVEACRRGLVATGDPVFRAASERVVRRTLRAMRRGAGSPFA